MIHEAVLAACDALDGLRDGLIADPRLCKFDFASLTCRGEDNASCLTVAQVATARTLTSPAVHPKSGETIFPGLALGTELGWRMRIEGPAPSPLGTDFVRYAVFKNPDWDWRTFDLETAVVQADRIDGIDASADLGKFMRRGGNCCSITAGPIRTSRPNRRSTTTGRWSTQSARRRQRIGCGCFWRRAWGTVAAARD